VNHVGTDLTIAGSAIVILTALIVMVRAVFNLAVTFRDNTKATHELTGKLEDLTVSIDGRFDKLAERVTRLEARP
jgi:hypothetical protein